MPSRPCRAAAAGALLRGCKVPINQKPARCTLAIPGTQPQHPMLQSGAGAPCCPKQQPSSSQAADTTSSRAHPAGPWQHQPAAATCCSAAGAARGRRSLQGAEASRRPACAVRWPSWQVLTGQPIHVVCTYPQTGTATQETRAAASPPPWRQSPGPGWTWASSTPSTEKQAPAQNLATAATSPHPWHQSPGPDWT